MRTIEASQGGLTATPVEGAVDGGEDSLSPGAESQPFESLLTATESDAGKGATTSSAHAHLHDKSNDSAKKAFSAELIASASTPAQKSAVQTSKPDPKSQPKSTALPATPDPALVAFSQAIPVQQPQPPLACKPGLTPSGAPGRATESSSANVETTVAAATTAIAATAPSATIAAGAPSLPALAAAPAAQTAAIPAANLAEPVPSPSAPMAAPATPAANASQLAQVQAGALPAQVAAPQSTPSTHVRAAASGHAASAEIAGTRRNGAAIKSGTPDRQIVPSTEVPENQHTKLDGIASAMQGRAMAFKAQYQGSGSNAPQAADSLLGDRASQSATVSTSKSASAAAAPRQAATPQPQAATSASATSQAFNISAATRIAAGTLATSGTTGTPRPEASTALRQVIETAETMRSDGASRAEMQLKLDDGQLVTVRLQISQGAIHPIFKTESTELRQAIEQSWAGFRTTASEKGLQIASPVFESPSGGAMQNSFSNRQGSGGAGNERPETDGGEPTLFQSPGSAKTTQPTPASTESAGVQMYA